METAEIIPPLVEDIPVPVDVIAAAVEVSPAAEVESGPAAVEEEVSPAAEVEGGGGAAAAAEEVEASPAAEVEARPTPVEESPAPADGSSEHVVEAITAPIEVGTAPVEVGSAEVAATAAEKEPQEPIPSPVPPAAAAPGDAAAAPLAVVANFESALWEPQLLKYGLTGLLHVRQVLQSIPKPPEVEHMKFLVCPTHDDRFDGDGEPGQRAGGGERRGKGKNKDKGSGRGRNVPDMGRTEVLPGRQKGQWWRNVTETDVIVREGITIASKEIAKIAPGHYIQQAAGAEVFINGRACGLQRMPVLPKGWVTLDATAVGGPVYLQPVKAPKWKVVYTSGSKRGDIVVRSSISLDSKEVAVLLCGTEVEQSGPQERLEDGIIRMPIVFGEGVGLDPATSSSPKVRVGWVTCDATIMGGPQFFRPCSQPAEQEPAAQRASQQQQLGRSEQQQAPTQHSEQQQSEDTAPASLPPHRQAAPEPHTGGGAKWDKNRLWMVVSVEPNTKQLPVVTRPEPFAPGTGHVAPEDVIVRWLTNGDLVEQVGHSKKIRGYMVMPIKCRTSTDGERLPAPQQGAQPDGWVTRRSVDRSREEGRSSWFEELQADEDGAVRVRRPRGGGGGNVSCPTLTL